MNKTTPTQINDTIEEDIIRSQMDRKRHQLINKYAKKSKGAGDYYHNKVVQFGAHDDYVAGQDEGGEPYWA